MKLEYWVWLIEKMGWAAASDQASPHAPADPMDLMVVGHAFLLREVEVACIFLGKLSVQVNVVARTVTLLLPATKTDTAANGVKRTLGCTCSESLTKGCPYCAVRRVVANQLARLRYATLDDLPYAWAPLFGQSAQPDCFTLKTQVVKEMQRMASLLNLFHPKQPNLDVDGVTGHTLRRSGIKHLGRKGVPYAAIQWLARHSLHTTMLYLEQGMEECPQAQFTMLEAVSVGDRLTKLATKYSTFRSSHS